MENRCTACLSRGFLFNWNKILADNVSYADLFYRITSINDKSFADIQWLCNDCGVQIQEVYQFIKKATESAHTLQQEIYSKNNQHGAKSKIEELSIEILPLTEKKKQNQRKIQVTEEESESECSQDEENLETLDDNCSTTDDESQSPKPGEISFELVAVNTEETDFEKEFLLESESHDGTSQDGTSEKPAFECEHCEKSFKSASAKKRHIRVHDLERLLCDICPRTFKNIWSLTKHKKTHNENRTRNFPCDRCDLKFLTANALKGHQEIHDDKRQKRFQCDQCDKAFFQKGALNVHRRIHTGQLVQCQLCEKRYPRLLDLEIHMRSHTGEQPFKCSTCGAAFKYRSTLYNHVRKAHFGYIHKCCYCSKQYKDKQALMEHKKTHKNCAFRCVLCDKEMPKKYRLKRHIKLSHNIENPIELEQLIASCKSESRYRTMRKFTNIEYKNHIAQSSSTSSTLSKQKSFVENNNESE